MSDLEKLKKSFDELSVKYIIVTAMEEKGDNVSTDKYDGEITWDTAIKLENGIGYFEFYCLFYFLNGDFKGHGVWE